MSTPVPPVPTGQSPRASAPTVSTASPTQPPVALPSESPGTLGQRVAAWGVHIYTASGSVFAFLIVLAAIDGNEERALWLGLVALIIDGTDGMLARWLQVKRHVPMFDGARLDDIVDYLTYVFAPIVLLYTTDRLPDGAWGMTIAALPLLTSGYQFCRVDAKTEDHFFLGFPSYWNVVAFYAIVLEWAPNTTGIVLLVCSVLVFVPIRYLYPSRTEAYWQLNIALTVGWLATYAVMLAQWPDPSPIWTALSVVYLVYYLGISLFLTAQSTGRARSAEPVTTSGSTPPGDSAT